MHTSDHGDRRLTRIRAHANYPLGDGGSLAGRGSRPRFTAPDVTAILGSSIRAQGARCPCHASTTRAEFPLTAIAAGPDREDARRRWTPADQDLARSIWSQLTEDAKSLLEILMESPGRQFTGAEIGQLLRPSREASAVQGLLGQAGRLCKAAGMEQFWAFPKRDGRTHYWMTESVANLLRDARHRTSVSPRSLDLVLPIPATDDPPGVVGQLERLVDEPASPDPGTHASGMGAYPAEVREDAADLLRRLIGVPLSTLRGQRNCIVGVTSPNVLVATKRAPDGQPVPIEQVQHALDMLRANSGGVVVDPEHLGYRSSFIGAVLLTLPGARVHGSPPMLTLASFDGDEGRDADDNELTFEGSLTHVRQVEQRGEQAMLRRRLFGAQDNGTCALCGETYPVRFFYAAHIKRRSICSDYEKRDLDSVAMSACAFGCDALFESGYLAVGTDGFVTTSEGAVDGALRAPQEAPRKALYGLHRRQSGVL
ncbi:hypothetical protein GCM10009609_43650 [Pseudonocardia aurantiaca]|uniref:DUF6416 domain-containing protein n=1 Tax=Pseudonocardia aurantiaca TaxID=75290 RepID=A0ABW4FZ12_9PSEU